MSTMRVVRESFLKYNPAQIPWELEKFAEKIEKLKPKAVLEIGTAYGATLHVLAKLADPHATIISIDLPGGKFGGVVNEALTPDYRRLVQANQKLTVLRCDSHDPETVRKVRKALDGNQLDVLFIDGDHTYNGVKHDYELYSPFVKKGGVIAFHDVLPSHDVDCHVDQFWNEVKPNYPYEEIIENPNQGWAGIGLLTNSGLKIEEA